MPDTKAINERLDREAEERRKLNDEAARVMDASRPTPTQRENDLAKLGVDLPEKDDPAAPGMPSLTEQQRRMAEASGSAPYKTREAKPAPAMKPAP